MDNAGAEESGIDIEAGAAVMGDGRATDGDDPGAMAIADVISMKRTELALASTIFFLWCHWR